MSVIQKCKSIFYSIVWGWGWGEKHLCTCQSFLYSRELVKTDVNSGKHNHWLSLKILEFSRCMGFITHSHTATVTNVLFVSFKKEGISEGRALYPTAERRHPLLFD